MSAGTSFTAFGGLASVATADPDRLEDAAAEVRRTVDEFDCACSRFRPDSELSALNLRAGLTVRVGELLLDAVAVALHAAELSEGAVDPTVGAALIALGYDRDFDEVRVRDPARASPVPVRASVVCGWRTVELDRQRSTIRLARGTMLDLGATAKALAADRAVARAARSARCGALVSLGGDLAIAGQAPAEGWPVRVTDDHRSGVLAPGQTIVLRDGGLATSSTRARAWRMAAGQAHHLVDPRSGQSASGPWRTVSVAAASCLEANIASTAAIVRGSGALRWLGGLGLPARLVGNEGAVRHLSGWPAQGDDLPVQVGPPVAA